MAATEQTLRYRRTHTNLEGRGPYLGRPVRRQDLAFQCSHQANNPL